MTTQGRNTGRISRADSPADGATVRAADPPRYRLWFWFISLVLTGDETAFRRLIVLLLLLVVTLLALALVVKDLGRSRRPHIGRLADRGLCGPAAVCA